MELGELIKTVQKINLLSNSISRQKLAGGNISALKGRGIVFDSVRKYETGDDVRSINWSVTARFRETYVNTFNEDKVRRVWLLIDVSGSGAIGTTRRSKIDLEIEIAATIAYNAIRKNDSVGVIFFSDKIERLIMPIKGMAGFWHIAKAMVECKPCSGSTSIDCALNFLMKINCTSSLVFILSDFLTTGYERAGAIFAQQNDIFTIRVYDKIEYQLPKLGWVKLRDIEGGQQKWVNTSSEQFSKTYSDQQLRIGENYTGFIRKNGIKNIEVSTDEDIIEKLSLLMS
ncbi:MAG TPA: DUF58 domain-containing protein [Mucilaginibacter sp.]|nr:DUF58 domain-containing protein [Mucilaginibacter sp.]